MMRGQPHPAGAAAKLGGGGFLCKNMRDIRSRFMPFARLIVCFALLLLGGGAFAQEARNRVALVIGNSAYARAPLANPVNDAKLIAAKLKAQGFEVFASYDASQRDMKRAVQTFAATLRARGKDVVAFIFYAGHGVQVKGENYSFPWTRRSRARATSISTR
jgi:hypothetical protein